MRRTSFSLAVLCCAVAPGSAADDDRFSAFLETNCTDCHGEWAQEGGLRLDTLSRDPADADARRTWIAAFDRLSAGEMPPPDDADLTDDDRAAALAVLAESIRTAEAAAGRADLRRLNRVEYEYTLRDLLGLPHLEVADLLPPDAEAHGFDNVGEALRVSHVQLSRYLDAADAALHAAARLGPEPVHFVDRRRFTDIHRFTITKDRVTVGEGDDALAVMLRQPNTAQTPWRISDFQPPYPAHYRVRLRARAATFNTSGRINRKVPKDQELRKAALKREKELYDVQPPGETLTEPDGPQALALFADTRRLGVVDLNGEWSEPEITAFVRPGEELRLHVPTMTDATNGWKDKPYSGPAVVLDWIEIEGPLDADGSPAAWPTPGYRTLFGDLPVVRWTEAGGFDAPAEIEWPVHPKKHPKIDPPPKDLRLMVKSDDPEADARRLLARFADRTFRRPVPAGEVDRYLALVRDRLDEGATFDEALITGYTAVLCSPDFLYVGERPDGEDAFALAERLSYFLWRSMPDDELRALAASGELADDAVLAGQVGRLLDDPRSRRFVDDFSDQWLGLRAITDTLPDGTLYPEFDELLLHSMTAETRAFVAAMLARDLPARTAVDSDFTFANAPLAALYGLDGVEGVDLREVPLPAGNPRGGLLTQASVLKVTANGTSTSPVVRGAWVLDRLLGTPAPPPPPNVPAIEPDTRGAVTVRELLVKHRADTACAGCHAAIDPPGFALESFDAIGGYREAYRVADRNDRADVTVKGRRVEYRYGPAVDSTGETADGDSFANVDEFRRVLLADERQVARNLVNRLLIFGTGRAPTFTDRDTVEAILDRAQPTDYGFRTLVREVVLSEAFRGR